MLLFGGKATFPGLFKLSDEAVDGVEGDDDDEQEREACEEASEDEERA